MKFYENFFLAWFIFSLNLNAWAGSLNSFFFSWKLYMRTKIPQLTYLSLISILQCESFISAWFIIQLGGGFQRGRWSISHPSLYQVHTTCDPTGRNLKCCKREADRKVLQTSFRLLSFVLSIWWWVLDIFGSCTILHTLFKIHTPAVEPVEDFSKCTKELVNFKILLPLV